jgi:WD40 repeat protein
VACLPWENRVVIHDPETGDQKVIEIERPRKGESSQYYIAITFFRDDLRLYSTDGVLVHIILDSTDAYSVAFHPRNTNTLAVGYDDGKVCMWDVSTHAYVSSFKQHSNGINRILFGLDGRLFLSSWDKTASIAALDGQFQIVSSVKFEGHTDFVRDVLPLPSNQCVTCSDDKTLKVWGCETGACLRTLTEHTNDVSALAMHPKGKYFASGSHDQSVIIWSSETFEVLHRIIFPSAIQSLTFGRSDLLYAGVYDHGVLSCDAFTGEIGHVIFPGEGHCESLSLGKTALYSTKHTTRSHS